MADKTTEVMPDAIAPNVQMSLAPNGYIRVVLGYDLLSSAFYLDGNAARVLSGHFTSAADAFDDAWKKIQDATNEVSVGEVDVLDLTARLQTMGDAELDELIALDAEFEEDVEDELMDKNQFDA